MSKRKWTPEEEALLKQRWGDWKTGLPGLAKLMGRSEIALKERAQRLKLGAWLDGSEYVTLNQLRVIITDGPAGGNSYTTERWRRMGLPIRKQRVLSSSFYTVRITDFWKWAKAHQGDLDFSRFEEDALGMEPEWAKEKRRVDRLNKSLEQPKKQRWTDDEVHHLRCLLDNGATWPDLERELRRTSGAIRRKIYDLYLPAPRRSRGVPWAEADHRQLIDLVSRGYSVGYAARVMGRSPEAVRGRIDFLKKRGEWPER